MNWDMVMAAEMMATTTVAALAALAAWLSYGHVRLSRQPNIVPSLTIEDDSKIYLRLTNYGGTAVNVKIRITHDEGPLVEKLNQSCPALRNGIDVIATGHTLNEPIGTIDPIHLQNTSSPQSQDESDQSGATIRYTMTIDWSLPGVAKRKSQAWALVLDQGTVERSARKR